MIEMPLSARGDEPARAIIDLRSQIAKLFALNQLASVSLHVKVPCVGGDLNGVQIACLALSTHRDSDPAAGLTWGWR